MSIENEKDEPPRLVEEGDGSLTVESSEPQVVLASDGDDHDDEQDDRRLNETDTDELGSDEESDDERKARQERNRARRMANKESKKNYIESLKRELSARDEIINDLSTRIASVEQHSVGHQAAQLDSAITEAANYYNHFKEANRKAIEVADGASAVDAQEKMFAAKMRYDMLQNAKKNIGRTQQQPKPLDPRMVSKAQTWIEKNSWYDPSGSDADSDIAMKIDNRLVQEGWNPTTDEYWEELDSRIKKYLPHKAVQSYNRPQSNGQSRPRVPVSGSGNGDVSASNSKGGYRLSSERVTALKDAGIYDDPKKLSEAIKRFQEYDRNNSK